MLVAKSQHAEASQSDVATEPVPRSHTLNMWSADAGNRGLPIRRYRYTMTSGVCLSVETFIVSSWAQHLRQHKRFTRDRPQGRGARAAIRPIQAEDAAPDFGRVGGSSYAFIMFSTKNARHGCRALILKRRTRLSGDSISVRVTIRVRGSSCLLGRGYARFAAATSRLAS
jgi:hypothetical protein